MPSRADSSIVRAALRTRRSDAPPPHREAVLAFSRSLRSMTPFPSLLRHPLRTGCVLLSLTFSAHAAAPKLQDGPPPRPADAKALGTVSRSDYQDDPKAFDKLDLEVAAVGHDSALLLDLEQKLTALLIAPTTTAAARQAIAERLGRVIAPDPGARSPALRLLGPWLADPARQEIARLALDSVPGENVDAAYLAALRRAEGAARIGLTQSVGTRRIAKAAPTLATYLKDGNPTLAEAAAAALGAIATPRAFGILNDAKTPVTPAVLTAQLDAAPRQPTKVAAATYRAVMDSRIATDAIRQRAFRSLLSTVPAEATSLVLSALTRSEATRRAVALEAVIDLKDPEATSRLIHALPSLDADTQAALVAGLARRGDAAAVPAIIRASRDGAPELRRAALTALGELPGNAASVQRLTEAILAGGGEAKGATQSLSILRGTGVAEAIGEGARVGEPARRAALIRQLGLRGATHELGYLLSLRTDSTLAVRLAALEALEILASPAEEAALIAWAKGAADAAERTRAVRTYLAAILRAPDTLDRTRLLVREVEQGDPSAQLLFLPALPRLPNSETLALAGRLARSADAAVAEAAFTALGRWPDSSAGDVLVGLATERESLRSRASDTATRLFERDTGAPSDARVGALIQLLSLSSDPALLRRQLLLLSRAANSRALSAAERLQANPTLARDAEDTVLAIRSNLGGAPILSASDRVDQLSRMLDGQANTAWSVRADRESWLQIDFPSSRPVRRLTLDRGNQRNDIPDRYEVFVTDNPNEPGAARVVGEGSRDQSAIDLPAGIRGRYVIIRNRGTREDGRWSIAELRVD